MASHESRGHTQLTARLPGEVLEGIVAGEKVTVSLETLHRYHFGLIWESFLPRNKSRATKVHPKLTRWFSVVESHYEHRSRVQRIVRFSPIISSSHLPAYYDTRFPTTYQESEKGQGSWLLSCVF